MAHHWYSAHDSAWALIAAWQAAAQAGRAVAAAERLCCWPACLNCGIRCRTPPSGSARIIAGSWKRPPPRPRTPGSSNAGSRWPPQALKELDLVAEPERVAKLLGDRGHFKMKLGRKDFARDLEDALQYVPADVSPAIRVDILLALAHCPVKETGERSYAEEALALARASRQRGERGERAADAGHVQRRPRPAGPLGQRSARPDRAGPRHGRAQRRMPPIGSARIMAGSWKRPPPRPATPESSNVASRWPPRRCGSWIPPPSRNGSRSCSGTAATSR